MTPWSHLSTTFMSIIVSDEFGERKVAGEEIPNTQIQVADHKKFPDRYQPTS